MGRSKAPEQTQETILNAATRLFIEKGFEQTSIQDVLDAAGLSKGGLYHHFKSKEEILDAVMERRTRYVSNMLNDIIRNTEAVNAKAKLIKILNFIAADTETHSLDMVLSAQVNNPHFVVSGIKNCVKLDAPVIGRLIADGVADGSIVTEEPELCAELFLLLLNFWLNPVLFHRGAAETGRRMKYLQSFMKLIGVDIIDEAFIAQMMKAYGNMGAFE